MDKKTLEVENVKLNKEIEKLIGEIATLEARVGRGEFNPKTTKVNLPSFPF